VLANISDALAEAQPIRTTSGRGIREALGLTRIVSRFLLETAVAII
jgi:hypothetical protein